MARKNNPGIFLVLLILLVRHLAAESGSMYFALLNYNNPGNRQADGKCCSGYENKGTCIKPCEILFNVTVSGSDGPSVTMRLSNGTVTVNENSTLGTVVSHPYIFPFTDWPACVDVRVDVYDEDSSVTTEDSNHWQLVDYITLHVQPFETPDSRYKGETLNGSRTLIPPSSLQVIIRFDRNRSNEICNGDNCSDNDTRTHQDFLHSTTSSTSPAESNNIPICASYSSSTFSQPSETTVSMTEGATELNTSYADKTTSDVDTPTSGTRQTTAVTTTQVNLSQESSEEPGNILTTTMTYSTMENLSQESSEEPGNILTTTMTYSTMENLSQESSEEPGNILTTTMTYSTMENLSQESSEEPGNILTTTMTYSTMENLSQESSEEPGNILTTTMTYSTMENLSQESSEEPGNILTTTMTYSTNDEANWSEKSTEQTNPTTTLARIVESSQTTGEMSTSVPVLTTTQWTEETTWTTSTLMTALTTSAASPPTMNFSKIVLPFTTGVTGNTSDSFMPTTTVISHDLMQYWEIILGCILGVLILIAIVGFLVYLKRQRAMLKRQVIYTVTPRLASVVEENGTAGKSDIPVETTGY